MALLVAFCWEGEEESLEIHILSFILFEMISMMSQEDKRIDKQFPY